MLKTKVAAMICLISSCALCGVFYPDGATTLHFAFEGSPNPDRPIIRPPAYYRADDGFGFVDSPTVVGTSSGCTAPKYFRWDVNLPEGNYDVAVTMGGTQAESVTTLKAEGHRAMLLDVRSSRQRNIANFTVNVRHGDGQSLDTDKCLNLEFVGVNPSMMKLDIKPNDKAITVYLVGDSLAADQNGPTAGWGQMLPLMFKAGEVAVANYAGNDAIESQLAAISKLLKPGDFVLVQTKVQKSIDAARQHQATAVAIDLDATIKSLREKLSQNSTKAFADDKHLTPFGALEVAKLVAMEIQQETPDLKSHLVEGITPITDPAQFPGHLGYEYLSKEQ